MAEVEVILRPVEQIVPPLRGLTGTEVRVSSGRDGRESKDEEPFTNFTFPGSDDEFMPDFLNGSWQFRAPDVTIDMLKSPTGQREIEAKNKTWLDQIVQDCKLTYPNRHPKAGEVIMTANPRDENDYFFTHNAFRLKFKEGNYRFKTSEPIHQVIMAMMKASRKYSTLQEYEELKKPAAYILVSTVEEKDLLERESTRMERAFAAYLAIKGDETRLKEVYIALGETAKSSVDEMRGVILSKYVKNVNKTMINGRSLEDILIRVCEMKPERLQVQVFYEEAKKSGMLQYVSPDGYMLNNQFVGANVKEVQKWFSSKENQAYYKQLCDIKGYNDDPLED